MKGITRRGFFGSIAAAGFVPAVIPSRADAKDDGPLLADDVTGTTAYADWHERKYGSRPE